ncbi:MAG: addiction module protein [Acidobacteria bacterium]|nr:addiction module protein [Acidobacteriota bacterium]
MTSEAKALLDQALQLPDDERAEMAALLLRSLDAVTDEGAEEAWDREIERRLAEVDAGAVELMPWDEAKHRIFRSLDEPE